jgi:hypothetical protein
MGLKACPDNAGLQCAVYDPTLGKPQGNTTKAFRNRGKILVLSNSIPPAIASNNTVFGVQFTHPEFLLMYPVHVATVFGNIFTQTCLPSGRFVRNISAFETGSQ